MTVLAVLMCARHARCAHYAQRAGCLPDPSLKVARTVLIELPRHHLVDETAVLTNYRIHSASLDCNYTD